MAAQELRWLTYLLTDLGEQPRSPPVLYVDNKAMLALCREHRLEHRTKHIALRYFLARELQQRGQLRLAYVASQANTADIFTKALPPGDHQRFCTMLGLLALLCLTGLVTSCFPTCTQFIASSSIPVSSHPFPYHFPPPLLLEVLPHCQMAGASCSCARFSPVRCTLVRLVVEERHRDEIFKPSVFEAPMLSRFDDIMAGKPALTFHFTQRQHCDSHPETHEVGVASRPIACLQHRC
ncbi:unnamed protein product [Closterium sp. NIES-53]